MLSIECYCFINFISTDPRNTCSLTIRDNNNNECYHGTFDNRQLSQTIFFSHPVKTNQVNLAFCGELDVTEIEAFGGKKHYSIRIHVYFYFPKNIKYLMYHLLAKSKTTERVTTRCVIKTVTPVRKYLPLNMRHPVA